ncbi:MAG TPA: response regulator transcription factor, partial [Flavobacterium sp.]
MIRIGIVEDHFLVRKSLIHLISDFADIEVVLEAENGRQLMEILPSIPLEILVLDIRMPDIDGYQACVSVRNKYPDIKILMMSHLTSRQTLHRVIACGAHGFFSKNSKPHELEIAIKSIMNKEYYFDLELGEVLREAMLEKRSTFAVQQLNVISDREIDVIRLAAKEMNSFEIADKLNINVRTVETHRKHIMEKTYSKNFI